MAKPLWCISFSTTLRADKGVRRKGRAEASGALLSDVVAQVGHADGQVSDVRAPGLARQLRVRDAGRLSLLLLLHGKHRRLDLLQVHSLYGSVPRIVPVRLLPGPSRGVGVARRPRRAAVAPVIAPCIPASLIATCIPASVSLPISFPIPAPAPASPAAPVSFFVSVPLPRHSASALFLVQCSFSGSRGLRSRGWGCRGHARARGQQRAPTVSVSAGG